MRRWPFKIVQGEHDTPFIEVHSNDEPMQFTSEGVKSEWNSVMAE
jgi:hypothetical protein